MAKFIMIKGAVRNLKIEDSKIFPFKNIESQAAGTAMLGALIGSTSLVTNAPIMMMAARGEDAKSFICEVGDYRVIGQFTTVQFQNGDKLIWVISREKEQGKHLVYAVLDPKTGLMHMISEMGRSLKQGYISIIKAAVILGVIAIIFINTIMLIGWLLSDRHITISVYGYILPLVIAPFIFTFLCMLATFVFSRDLKQACRLSEEVFSILNFENVKNQDFFSGRSHFKEHGHTLKRSVMYYRNNLKGKDPYPEDYFDKHPIDEK